MRRPSRQGLEPVCVHCTAVLLAISIILLLTGCFPEDDIPPEFQITSLRPATKSFMVDVTVATFGSRPVADFGVVYGETPSPDINSTRISIKGDRRKINTCSVDYLKINTSYHVRAFIMGNDSSVIYSNEMVTKTLMHSLQTFYPRSATIHDKVTIIGKNFVQHATRVFLDDTPVEASVTTDTITFVPPLGLPTDVVKIAVEIDGARIPFAEPLQYRNGRWTQLRSIADEPGAPRDVGYITFGLGISGKIYTISQLDHFSPGAIREYDPETEVWTEIAYGHATRDNFTQQWFAIGDQIFFLAQHQLFRRLDLNDRSWHTLAEHPFPDFLWGTAFSFNGDGFAGLGRRGGEETIELWKFDYPNNKWSHVSDYPGTGPAAVLSLPTEHAVYFIGGMQVTPSEKQVHKEVWRYDPVGNTWERRSDYPGEGNVFLNGLVLNGNLIVGGGSHEYQDIDFARDYWEYDVQTDRWVRLADMPVARQAMYGYGVGNVGYFGAGQQSLARWSYNVWKLELK